MRLALKYIKKISIVMVFVSFMFVAKKARNYIFSIDGYSCNFDSLISCDQKRKIFNFVNLNQDLKTYSLEDIAEKIKENFGVIKKIELSHSANGIVSLNIFGDEPKYILNGDYVLTLNKDVFEKNLFAKKALENCKTIIFGSCYCANIDTQNIDLKKEVTESCKNMIFSLPNKYFKEYEIIRESSAKSYMLDKSNKNFSILFNDFVMPDDRLLAYCLYIKNDLQLRGEFNRKVQKNWVADIRFSDQIVVVSK